MLPAPAVAADKRHLTWALLAGLVVALFAWQFVDLGRSPLQVWDESRLAVNAVEMLQSGERFVTTYGFHVDLWNTKPPLVINLMAWSMQLFGPTPFAARIPSALAMCATVIVVGVGVRRVTGSLGGGVAAAVLLAVAPPFYGYHSGQTGDYDGILTLFTTAYGFALFDLIERDRPAPALALGIGVLVGLAILTKGIAGIIPGVGIAAFALVFALPALRRKLGDYAIVGITGALIGGGFYLLRGRVGDGYLAAVAVNELAGRYGVQLEQHREGPRFYIDKLSMYVPGKLWFAVAALPLLPGGPARRLAIFAACQIAGLVLVYSNAATKIAWYIVPAIPFVAVLVALAGLAVAHYARRFSRPWRLAVWAALAATAALIGTKSIYDRYANPFVPPTRTRAFGALIAAAAARHMVPLVVVDGGFDNGAGFRNYAPTLRFYALAAARSGVAVTQADSPDDAKAARYVGSCDPKLRVRVEAEGTRIWSASGCVLVARGPRTERSGWTDGDRTIILPYLFEGA